MDPGEFIRNFGLLVPFLNALLENSGIPVPSEATWLLTGYLAGRGQLGPLAALGAGLLGASIGAILSYRIGAAVGTGWILRAGRRLGVREEHVRRAEQWLSRHGTWAVLLGRFVPFVRALVGYPAGMTGMPFGRYLVLSMAGYGTWAAGSLTAGYLLGENWQLVLAYTEELLLVGGLLAALYLGVRIWRRATGRSARVPGAD